MHAGCTERTFWKYHKLGLVPEGQKVPGNGNVAYFPDDTPLRLWLINFLTRQLEFSLQDIAGYPWEQFERSQRRLTQNHIPDEVVVETKNQFKREKRRMIQELIGRLIGDLTSGKNDRRSERWNHSDGSF
jgi:DNA-binding transcriptional MerR regulator